MKLPFTINIGAVKGVFSRLNPSGLLAKLPGKLGGKKKDAGDASDDEDLAAEEDMFADLGDLDQLDADAAARQAGEGEDGEQELDYTTDAYATDKEVDLDDMTSADDGGETDEAQFADLDADADADEGEEVIDLSTLEAMPGFDEDLDDEEEEQAATSAKKKKLLLIAGGGVAAAVLIGAATWLLLGGDGTDSPVEPETIDLAAMHDAVVSLDNIPMVSQEAPSAPALTPPSGDMPGDGGAPDGGPAEAMGEEGNALAQLGLNVAQEPGVGVVVPSVTKASFVDVPSAPPGTPLPVAPVDILVEQTDVGILPRIAEDGLTAYDAYARPEPQLDAAKPKIAIIVTGVGMSRAATEAAIAAMPENVTLSLDVYARGLDFWIARAREDGHEVLLGLPLESATFPFNDPGPEALRVLGSPEENVQKLEYILSRTTGYFGVLADHGGKFLTVEDQVGVVMEQLKARGLMYVDGGVQGSLGTRAAYKLNVPWAAVEINLDHAQSRAALRGQLEEFAQLAQKRAISVARVSATPLAMAELSIWLGALEQKGFQLVPVSALAKKQLIR